MLPLLAVWAGVPHCPALPCTVQYRPALCRSWGWYRICGTVRTVPCSTWWLNSVLRTAFRIQYMALHWPALNTLGYFLLTPSHRAQADTPSQSPQFHHRTYYHYDGPRVLAFS